MKKILLAFIALLPLTAFAQDKCACENNFAWLKETFEKNDAGFEYGLSLKGKDAYEVLVKQLSEEAKKTTDIKVCAELLRSYLKFFRKGHWSIDEYQNQAPKQITSVNTTDWPTVSLSETELKKKIDQLKKPSIEGIWYTAPYTIGVVKEGHNYTGYVLDAPGSIWKKGQVKFSFSDDPNSDDGTWYMGNYSETKFSTVNMLTDNYLEIGNFKLKRVYPVLPADPSDREISWLTEQYPFLAKVNANTVYLRIPSFNDSYKRQIDSVLRVNDKTIKAAKNMIIDVRDNGGGSDASYDQIIPYLYTNPMRHISVEFLSTPLNNSRMDDIIKNPNFDPKDIAYYKKFKEKLDANIGKFVPLNNPTYTETMDIILPNPANVAIIINENCGSTTEQFLLAAKQSKKVKLYGTTTIGVLDISNMYHVPFPCEQLGLGYALSKSYRIPGMALDGKGIQPDFYIDPSIPSTGWIQYVESILNAK
ncbi:peptidase S41-like protein [Chitinophaga skermanii]|uniref:Peptidase S41-like protein n=1 Tax=Chitinophaga skermanii TaxID=331697 RepID=A0A327QYH1_9BACT|nr:S41 family peptidase [Chitinophaga skermanii]RAJ08808.1 peptidase S41-like protein [Chitinophaga skermanii]